MDGIVDEENDASEDESMMNGDEAEDEGSISKDQPVSKHQQSSDAPSHHKTVARMREDCELVAEVCFPSLIYLS